MNDIRKFTLRLNENENTHLSELTEYLEQATNAGAIKEVILLYKKNMEDKKKISEELRKVKKEKESLNDKLEVFKNALNYLLQ